jgi:hypothetical protein
LGLLVEAFVWEGPLILGIDETLERRWGKKISTNNITHTHRSPLTFTKFSSLERTGSR